MRRIVMLLAWVITYSSGLIAQELNSNTISINVFNPFVSWQASKYTGDDYDYLGIGTFVNPEYKLKLDRLSLKLDLTLGNFNFIGPDELTETGTEDDIDFKFNSKMEKRDLGFQINYNVSNSIDLFLRSSYIFMNIEGDKPNKFDYQKPFSYLEKGVLIGPGVDLNWWPINNSKSFFHFSMSFLLGQIKYTYFSHRKAEMNTPDKEKIETEMLSAKASYNFPVYAALNLGISLKSDYFFKTKYSLHSRYREDLWFWGLNTSLSYSL